MAANSENTGSETFRLFQSTDEGKNAPNFGGLGFFDSPETPLPPPPPCEEILPSEVSTSVKYAVEQVDLGGVTLLKGRVSTREVFALSNSDLVPGKYEGGLKLWEGSLDLVKALHSEIQKGDLSFEGKKVLEDGSSSLHLGFIWTISGCTPSIIYGHMAIGVPRLQVIAQQLGRLQFPSRFLPAYKRIHGFNQLGCGHGLPGIFACLKGAGSVHFQDFNAEVLKCLTLPNVNANLPSGISVSDSCKIRYFAGDWGEVDRILPHAHTESKDAASSNDNATPGYDLILMAETVYSISTLPNLYSLIKKCVSRPHGIIYMAAKKHYFGVGGGSRRFLSIVENDSILTTSLIAEVVDGSSNVREVWKLSCK